MFENHARSQFPIIIGPLCTVYFCTFAVPTESAAKIELVGGRTSGRPGFGRTPSEANIESLISIRLTKFDLHVLFFHCQDFLSRNVQSVRFTRKLFSIFILRKRRES